MNKNVLQTKNFIIKFIDDTLKIKGKFSMKRVLVAVTFPNALSIAHKIVDNESINGNAIVVLQTLFAFITAVVITNAYAKKQEIKDDNYSHDTENLG